MRTPRLAGAGTIEACPAECEDDAPAGSSAPEEDAAHDRLAPARGLLVGLFLGAAFWTTLFAIAAILRS
jgi:hypothetical protein